MLSFKLLVEKKKKQNEFPITLLSGDLVIVKSYISVTLCHFSAFIDMSYENYYLYRTSHLFYLNMKLLRDIEQISFVLVLYKLNIFCV